MASVNPKLRQLRALVRANSKSVVDTLIEKHINRLQKDSIKQKIEICSFCGKTKDLTKEHVLPRWTFDKSTEGFFITDINGFSQTYNRTTIPACVNCNSDILNSLEKYIFNLFTTTDVKAKELSAEELQNIIRWLELIDYKFQILNIIRKFKASKQGGYISYLADIPLSLLRLNGDFSTSKVIAEIRRSQKRLTIKNKLVNINSLIIFKTTNPSFNFFHQMDEFIFIELPKLQVAIFYFYRKLFEKHEDAYKSAMEIIKTFY